MLRSFRLANHKSIRGEAELSLLPVYRTDRAIQTVSAIYGANASGKSNLLDGLRFMQSAVLDSYSTWVPDDGVPRNSFRLDPVAHDEPSYFVVDLELDGVRYTYGFAVDDRAIQEEWLHSYPEKKKRIIFERRHGELKFGSTVQAPRSRAAVLEDLTRPDALFLSVASRVGFDESLPVDRWFRSGLAFRFARPARRIAIFSELIASFVESSPERHGKLVELLRLADVGITGMSVEEADQRSGKTVVFTHSSTDAKFAVHDESAGTRAWLDILRVVLAVLENGSTLVVDEIDTSLHPALTARLLALFQGEDTNPHSAQLICTTHDTTLLGPTLGEQVLTRGQVWFTEKNAAGETSLYPLSDFSPRTGENTERRYLGGSYGAIPRLFAEDFAAAVRESDAGSARGDQA